MLIVACRAAAGTTGIDVRRALPPNRRDDLLHAVDRAHAKKRHAAMRNPPARRELEPVDAAVTGADPIDVERLRDDDVVGPRLRDTAHLGQVRDAGKAAALFVHGPADLDRARHRHAGARDGLGRKDGGRDAGFHVADTAADDAAVAKHTGKRIHRPAIARRHDIDMSVQMDDGPGAAPARADDVDAWVAGRVLGAALSRDVLDFETAARQAIAEKPRADFVVLSGGVDGRDAHQRLCELDDLVRRAIDFRDDPIDGMHASTF
jgi:hypothetical protein